MGQPFDAAAGLPPGVLVDSFHRDAARKRGGTIENRFVMSRLLG
jgi:hypothetical protein